jgi:hypothetical protein
MRRSQIIRCNRTAITRRQPDSHLSPQYPDPSPPRPDQSVWSIKRSEGRSPCQKSNTI